MKKIDVTLRVTPKMVTDAQNNEKKAFTGHFFLSFCKGNPMLRKSSILIL